MSLFEYKERTHTYADEDQTEDGGQHPYPRADEKEDRGQHPYPRANQENGGQHLHPRANEEDNGSPHFDLYVDEEDDGSLRFYLYVDLDETQNGGQHESPPQIQPQNSTSQASRDSPNGMFSFANHLGRRTVSSITKGFSSEPKPF